MADKETGKLKFRKKNWYKIISPKIFGCKEIGESYLSDPESSLGRVVKANLKDLTGNVRDQNAYAVLRINKVSKTCLETETLGYELTPAHIKRQVRKNTLKSDDYFLARTKDGKNVLIKTLMITLRKTQRPKMARLRKALGTALKEEVAKSDFDLLIGNLVSGKIQFNLKKTLHKIYPLRELAVRTVKPFKKDKNESEKTWGVLAKGPEEGAGDNKIEELKEENKESEMEKIGEKV